MFFGWPCCCFFVVWAKKNNKKKQCENACRVVWAPPASSAATRPPRIPALVLWKTVFCFVFCFFCCVCVMCSVIQRRHRRCSSQHHVVPGWYQHVPDEDRGRTGSVKVHRLSGVRGARRRRGLAPPPTLLTPSPSPCSLPPHTHTPHAHTAHTHSLMEPALTTDPNCL